MMCRGAEVRCADDTAVARERPLHEIGDGLVLRRLTDDGSCRQEKLVVEERWDVIPRPFVDEEPVNGVAHHGAVAEVVDLRLRRASR